MDVNTSYKKKMDIQSVNLINVTISEGVGVIEINRPSKLNSLSTEVMSELNQAFDELENASEVKVIILRGAGDKAFAAGADLAELAIANDTFTFMRCMDNYFSTYTKIMELSKPVIAAVNGYAYGGACALAFSCDYVIATKRSKFGQQEINYGFFGGAAFFTKMVGKIKAAEIVMLGEPFDAAEAYRLGLINKLVEKEDFEATVKEACDKFMEKSPWALKLIKKTIKLTMDSGLEAATWYEVNSLALCRQTEESRELLKEFIKE